MKGRPSAVLFVLALLMALSFAQSFNVDPYLYDGETADSVTVSRLASGYDLVTISGVKTFILFEGLIVDDEGAIRDALRGDYRTTAVPSPEEREEVLTLARMFNATRNTMSRFGAPSEDLCMAQTGITMYKATALGSSSESPYCYDHRTCVCPPWLSCGQSDYAPWSTEAKIVHGKSLYAIDSNLTALEKNLAGLNVDSAPQLLDAAVEDLQAMKKNARFIKSSALQISAPLGTCNPANFDPEYVDALRQIILDTYGGSILSVYPPPYCLDLCPDVDINMSLLDDAIAKAEELRARAAPLGDVTNEAAAILATTKERQTYLSNAENARAYRTIYGNVGKTLDRIHTLTNVSALRNAVLNDVVTLDVLEEQINSSIATNNFALAEQLVAQFNNRSMALNARLDRLMPTYDKTAKEKRRLENEILMVSYNLQPSETDAQAELDELKNLKYDLDSHFNGAQSLNEFTVLELNYTLLADRAQSLNDGLESLHSSQVGNIVGGVTQAAMIGSLSIWDGVSPMTPEQMRENGRLLPALLIGAGDVLTMAIIFGTFAFFAFVNKRIVWRKNVAVTWALIFVVFFAILGLASYGVYELVQRQAEQPTTLGQFNGAFSGSSAAAVAYDVSGLGQSQIAALQSCKDRIAAKLGESNVTVKSYTFSGDSCRLGTVTKTAAECDAEMADVPQFRLQYGTENSVRFYSFYDTRAMVVGDASYFRICDIASVI